MNHNTALWLLVGIAIGLYVVPRVPAVADRLPNL